MKTIIAIIKPFKLDEVREGLREIGVSHLTMTEAKGFAINNPRQELYRGAEYIVDYLPKIELIIAVEDELVEQAVETIVQAARTGRPGDGCVMVLPVEWFRQIRTDQNEVKTAAATG